MHLRKINDAQPSRCDFDIQEIPRLAKNRQVRKKVAMTIGKASSIRMLDR